MTCHRVALAQCTSQPWRNGGGRTRELIAWPSADNWRVRVSVAEIDTSGPFSKYPGVERWFVVLHGDGVVLTLSRGRIPMTPGTAPLHFDGEETPECLLTHGPTLDLNFMVQRDAGRALLQPATRQVSLTGPTLWRGLYAAERVDVDFAGVVETVEGGEFVWSDDRQHAVWNLCSAGRAWWMEVRAS